MIASTETCHREWQAGHRIGEQEGRQKALLSERAEYVRLFGGGETNQASASVGARDASFWPSRSDWHAAYRSGAILCYCRMQAAGMHSRGWTKTREEP